MCAFSPVQGSTRDRWQIGGLQFPRKQERRFPLPGRYQTLKLLKNPNEV